MGSRFKHGFRPPRFGRRGEAIGESARATLLDRFLSLFDPTVTTRTIINEGAVFGAFALWCVGAAAQAAAAIVCWLGAGVGGLTVCCPLLLQTHRRVLFSSDQSFPLAGAFAYSVYQFQSKRVKRDPDGPFLGGNAIVGAIISTLCCLAIACGVSWSCHAAVALECALLVPC
jgi:ATP-dependent HslUV protease ATP-binding subunit HslU